MVPGKRGRPRRSEGESSEDDFVADEAGVYDTDFAGPDVVAPRRDAEDDDRDTDPDGWQMPEWD